MKQTSETPKLAAPGAGLPIPARWIVRLLGCFMLRKQFTVESALLDMERTAQDMLQRVSSLSDEDLETPVLVPRLRGLEDSSRFWSPGMVLEHLCLTTPSMLRLAIGLSNGAASDQVVSTANVKPQGKRGRSVLTEFQDCHLGAGDRTKAALGQDLNGLTHRHPWFGPLTAGDWIRLAAGHLRIHQRQLSKILENRKVD